MHIHFERSGGFVGMRITASLDIDSLEAQDAAELRQLIADANFFDLPENITGARPYADMYHYRVTVRDATRQHTVSVDQNNVPETLQPLLKRLTRLARSQK